MISLIVPTLNIVVFISNVLFFVALALFMFSEKGRSMISHHISHAAPQHIFFVSLIATLGSLSLSTLVGWVPCELCWFQRIFMYPQAIISLIAMIRKETQAVYYSLTLSIIGGLIALYHSYIQWGGTHSVLPCTLNGGECGKLYIYAYNYITIPFMALSAFVYIICFCLIYIYGRKD